MKLWIKRIGSLLLALGVIYGCSRKPDEELPPQVGDFIVNFKVLDESGLPASIPVTVSIYNDTTRIELLKIESVNVVSDVVKSVEFKDLRKGFAYLELRITAPSVAFPTCPNMTRIFVILDDVSETNVIIMTVRQGSTTCE